MNTKSSATQRMTKLAAIPLHERFLLDEETASIMCSVSRTQYRKWVKSGKVKPVALPSGESRNLYRRDDVKEFVDSLRLS